MATIELKKSGFTKDISLQKLKEKIERVKAETTSQIDNQLQKIINDLTDDIEKKETLATDIQKVFKGKYDEEVEDKIENKPGHLPEKQFTERNSLLTDLLEIKHLQTIYHIFLAILFGLFVNTTAYDLLEKGEAHWGLRLIRRSFNSFPTLISEWLHMFFTTLLTYVGFHVWANSRIQFQPQSLKQLFLDRLFTTTYILLICRFIFVHTSNVVNYELSVAESMAVLCELTRLLMKSYAFVRSNVPRTLKFKLDSDDEQLVCPEFTKFIYFLFVPTLIYKDNYPRSREIRWRFVVKCFVEVLGCILYISFIFERFLIPVFEDFGLKKQKWQDLILLMLGNGMAGILVLLSTFYAILHAWMNGFAEMLRFGDRMFYKDWWTSTSYGRYYRTWNVVVHDWLYTYIYKDMYELVIPKNKLVAKFMVFFISAVFHEFILGFSFRFCYPILFIMFFGLGFAVSFLKWKHNTLGNSGMWYGLAVGMGIGISAYCMEFYARINCPKENDMFADYFIPRTFTCNKDIIV